MKRYITLNIILPLLLLICLPISIFVTISYFFEISEINLLFITLTIKDSNNVPNYLGIILSILILFTLFYVAFAIVRNFNKDREFLDGNIYGTKFYGFYKLATLLGFRKISLARKPYVIAFKVLLDNRFEVVNLAKENEELEKEVEISIINNQFNVKKKCVECNLVVSDTFEIDTKQLPMQKRKLPTLLVKRSKHIGIRVSSDKLANEVRRCVLEILETGAKINLFMTTSTYNTYKIVTEAFMQAGRDKINLEVFQQNMKDKKFSQKGYKIL